MVGEVEDAEALKRVKGIFGSYPERYWVCGGWAVDLHVGRVRRAHRDVDVMILADDVDIFASSFGSRPTTVTDHRDGSVRAWVPGRHLEPGRETLGFADEPGLEILLGLSDGIDWVFHRGRKTRRDIRAMTFRTPRGLPFLGPEILLLFKSRDTREKDQEDFNDLVGILSSEQAEWLLPRLGPPGAAEHPWKARLARLTEASSK